MGPPRAPGLHQVDPGGGQMMPPPNQNPAYPGYPYGSQPYRNAQIAPYGNYSNNQVSEEREGRLEVRD